MNINSIYSCLPIKSSIVKPVAGTACVLGAATTIIGILAFLPMGINFSLPLRVGLTIGGGVITVSSILVLGSAAKKTETPFDKGIENALTILSAYKNSPNSINKLKQAAHELGKTNLKYDHIFIHFSREGTSLNLFEPDGTELLAYKILMEQPNKSIVIVLPADNKREEFIKNTYKLLNRSPFHFDGVLAFEKAGGTFEVVKEKPTFCKSAEKTIVNLIATTDSEAIAN